MPYPFPSSIAAWLESRSGACTALTSVCSIGRTKTNNVVLADDRVSRRHASIYAQAEQEFWIVDLASANGTYVNGRRLMQPYRLADGDRIEIGGHGLTFRHPNQANANSPERATEKTLQDIRTLNCWLLVADIEGHTKMVQKLSPGEVSRITGQWLETCKETVDSNDGVVNKFLGDGFFAYWNADETGVVERVSQALRILINLQTSASPRFRWVIHYGRVYSGGPTFGEESLMGGEVNFIFRMEKLASKLRVPLLISEAAACILGPGFTLREAGRHPLAGFDGETLFFTI